MVGHLRHTREVSVMAEVNQEERMIDLSFKALFAIGNVTGHTVLVYGVSDDWK
ncbi:MAG: hypothetical protein ACJAYU_003316 [Bradymonadia bacterium]|jgi:hypothetical protein